MYNNKLSVIENLWKFASASADAKNNKFFLFKSIYEILNTYSQFVLCIVVNECKYYNIFANLSFLNPSN